MQPDPASHAAGRAGPAGPGSCQVGHLIPVSHAWLAAVIVVLAFAAGFQLSRFWRHVKQGACRSCNASLAPIMGQGINLIGLLSSSASDYTQTSSQSLSAANHDFRQGQVTNITMI